MGDWMAYRQPFDFYHSSRRHLAAAISGMVEHYGYG